MTEPTKSRRGTAATQTSGPADAAPTNDDAQHVGKGDVNNSTADGYESLEERWEQPRPQRPWLRALPYSLTLVAVATILGLLIGIVWGLAEADQAQERRKYVPPAPDVAPTAPAPVSPTRIPIEINS